MGPDLLCKDLKYGPVFCIPLIMVLWPVLRVDAIQPGTRGNAQVRSSRTLLAGDLVA